MNKYTVVYHDINNNTLYEHIETRPEDLIKMVELVTSWDKVLIVFEGHCQKILS